MNIVGNLVAFVLGVVVFLFTTSVLPERTVNAGAKKEQRGFYLTPTVHTGDQALTACVSGFHMASLWEILDPSHLRYDTSLGVTQADSGSGPPLTIFSGSGWVRTGGHAQGVGLGAPNCRAWSVTSNASGLTVRLADNWEQPGLVTPIAPWIAERFGCTAGRPVWCVED
jgi:hypothetical protein